MSNDLTPKKPRTRRTGDLNPTAATTDALEAPFGAIVELALDALVGIDEAGRISLVNRQTEVLFGYARERLLGRPVETLFPERIHDAHRTAYLAALQTHLLGRPVQLWGRRRDGSEFPAAVSFGPLPATGPESPIALVSTIRDLTEQRQLERQLRFQASMLERTHDAIFVWEVGGSIIYWNRGAELLYGYRASEALGQRSHNLLHTVHPAASPEEFEAMLLQQEEWTGELTHTAHDDHMIEVFSRHQVLREPDGHIYVLESSYDITERKRLEREREELLSLVAHDLASPLTSLKARTQLLQRQVASGKLLPVDAFDGVVREIGRMERLIADLRTNESLESGHFTLLLEPCDLVAICREAAEAAHLSTGRVVRLVLPEAPVVATIDCDRISQVLTNLLSNALKYSSADQPIELTLMTVEALADPEEAVTDSRATLQRVVRITVLDHGPGIPPEVRSHLFERYYRVPGVEALHSQRRGLGLGLYIARELVERHGGQIGVDSVVGDGSTFWLTLPLAPAEH